MTKEIKAWPFFIARNKYVEYTTVISPQFLIEGGDHRKLATSWTGGEPTDFGHAYKTVFTNQKYGKIILIYWIKTVESSEDSDKYGRETYWTEGLMIRDSSAYFDDRIPISIQEEISKKCTAAYVEFKDEKSPVVKVAESFTIPTTISSNDLIELTPYQPYLVSQMNKKSEKIFHPEHDEKTKVDDNVTGDKTHFLTYAGILVIVYLLYRLISK